MGLVICLMSGKIAVFGGFGVFGVVLLLSFFVHDGVSGVSGVSGGSGIDYMSSWCVVHERGGEVLSSSCDHNLLYTTGRNAIRDVIGNDDTSAPINIIGLCNVTAGCGDPVADGSDSFTNFSGCGLENAAGSFSVNQNGNWSLVNTFTSTCSVTTNKTVLFDQGGVRFAGLTFSQVDLEASDTITINITLSVE